MTSIAFVTHCSDDWFYPVGCNKLIQSAKYYHPDIPFFVFGSYELNKLNEKYNGKLNWDILNPVVSLEVAKHYDRVFHFDADSFICGTLTELLDADMEVVGVRNNNDINTASRVSDKPITINNCAPADYMNAGLVGASNPKFWEDWIDKNKDAGRYPYLEQDIYNLILQEKTYSFSCLDPIESPVYYGISCLSGVKTHWDSLKEVELCQDALLLNNKTLKVVHQAGGHALPKLVFENLFRKDVANYLNTHFNNDICEFNKLKL